jgi:hypothetical protein
VGVLLYGLSQEREQARGISAEVKMSEWTKKMKNLLGI